MESEGTTSQGTYDIGALLWPEKKEEEKKEDWLVTWARENNRAQNSSAAQSDAPGNNQEGAATEEVEAEAGKPNIDLDFLSKVEGGRRTQAYVPKNDSGIISGKSGPTIATGVDIGQMNENDLKWYGIDERPALYETLKPLVGLTREAAVEYLTKNPTSISREDALWLDERVQGRKIEQLAKRYEESPNNMDGTRLDRLPPPVQTVIYSVAHQYGDLANRTPHFWNYVTSKDWEGAYRELLDFKDKHADRRKEEAHYLNKGLSGGE